FFEPENAQPFLVSRADLGRIRTKECGRAYRHHAIHNREMKRHVMTFQTPAPRALLRGSAKDRKKVPLRIASEHRWTTRGGGLCLLDAAKGRFELHDLRRGEITVLAHACLQ